AEVVPRQHRARANWHTIATAWAGEDEEVRVAVEWELPADGLAEQWGGGEFRDAGVALRAGFEAAAELPAGLVTHLDDLEDGHGPIEMDPAAAQASPLTDTQ